MQLLFIKKDTFKNIILAVLLRNIILIAVESNALFLGKKLRSVRKKLIIRLMGVIRIVMWNRIFHVGWKLGKNIVFVLTLFLFK